MKYLEPWYRKKKNTSHLNTPLLSSGYKLCASLSEHLSHHTTAHRSVLEDLSSRGQDIGVREGFQEEESPKLTGKNG